jgi:4-hydroxybenzoate polyprenyltransferase
MKKGWLLFLAPLWLFLALFSYGKITQLLREPSDLSVTAGVILFCFFLAGSALLINQVFGFTKKNIRIW